MWLEAPWALAVLLSVLSLDCVCFFGQHCLCKAERWRHSKHPLEAGLSSDITKTNTHSHLYRVGRFGVRDQRLVLDRVVLCKTFFHLPLLLFSVIVIKLIQALQRKFQARSVCSDCLGFVDYFHMTRESNCVQHKHKQTQEVCNRAAFVVWL